MMEHDPIAFAELNAAHLPILLAWRQNPVLTRYLYSAAEEPLTWAAHLHWYQNRSDRWDCIVMLDDRPIGHASAKGLYDASLGPEVGILIGDPTLWGKGIGTEAVKYIVETLNQNQYDRCWAHIHDMNDPSIRLFKKLGFVVADQIPRDGPFRWWTSQPAKVSKR